MDVAGTENSGLFAVWVERAWVMHIASHSIGQDRKHSVFLAIAASHLTES
jgi:hypothetical protein